MLTITLVLSQVIILDITYLQQALQIDLIARSSVILDFVCTKKSGESALVGLICFLLPSVHFSRDNCMLNHYHGIVFAVSLCGKQERLH